MNDPTKLIKCAYDIFERCKLIGKIGGDGVVSCLKGQYKYYTYSRRINSSFVIFDVISYDDMFQHV